MPSSLTPAERLERQRTDHRLIEALNAADCPIVVTGHHSAEDARAGRKSVLLGDRNPPSHYRVVYDFDTLRGPAQRHRPTVVHISPLANGDYPATPPTAWVVSDVVPWTPHFSANVPICHGSHEWIPNRTQLVDYIIHIGRLLNFDEPPPSPGYHGYNAPAIAHWRNSMGLRPLDPSLKFPVLNPENVGSTSLFMPARPASASRFRGRAQEVARFRGADGGRDGFNPPIARS